MKTLVEEKMVKTKLLLKPVLKQTQTYSHSFQEYSDILKLTQHEIRAELLSIFKPNPYFFISNETIINTLHAVAEEGVKNDLYYQLHTCKERYHAEVCNYIIESLDEHGFFNYQKEQPFPFNQTLIDESLALIQSFDPFGIALENSTAYLCAQLKVKKHNKAILLLQDYSKLMIQQQLPLLCEKLEVDQAQLDVILQQIRSCRIYPCEMKTEKSLWIQPDVTITRVHDDLHITFEMNELPSISMPHNSLSDEALRYLYRMNMKIDMINQRNLTMMQIFCALIEIQKEALLNDSPLNPCRLEDISILSGVHISTISRVCPTKYYEWQGKTEPFSNLFASGNISGKSHEALRRQLLELIHQEDSSTPYSDEELIHLLAAQHIHLSRRGIAKLRTKWKIPNSYQRKKADSIPKD